MPPAPATTPEAVLADQFRALITAPVRRGSNERELTVGRWFDTLSPEDATILVARLEPGAPGRPTGDLWPLLARSASRAAAARLLARLRDRVKARFRGTLDRGTANRLTGPTHRGIERDPALEARCRMLVVKKVPDTYEAFEAEILAWIATCVQSRTRESHREVPLVRGNASLAVLYPQLRRGQPARVVPTYLTGHGRVEYIGFASPDTVPPAPPTPPSAKPSSPSKPRTIKAPKLMLRDEFEARNIKEKFRRLANYAHNKGWHWAESNVYHWLAGTGALTVVDHLHLWTFSPVLMAEAKNEARFADLIASLAAQLRDGQSERVDERWAAAIQGSVGTELFWASGGSTLHSSSKRRPIVVTRTGDKIRVKGNIVHFWYDRYDWDLGKGVSLPFLPTDDEARKVERYLGARPFVMTSTWEVYLDATLEYAEIKSGRTTPAVRKKLGLAKYLERAVP